MLPQVMLRRGGSCFRVEHLLLCGIPNLETIKQKQVNSASKPVHQTNKPVEQNLHLQNVANKHAYA
jgi:hypothetical protein